MTLYDEIKDQLKDSQGKFRTNSLFLEPNYGIATAVFTLKEEDHELSGKTFLSLKKIYLEIGDPTEYTFAREVFGSWDHWQRIRNNQVLAPYITAWAEELEIKLRAEAIMSILTLTREIETKNMPAMRWAAESGWKEAKRGRVSKKEKEQEVRKESGIIRSIREDLERMQA